MTHHAAQIRKIEQNVQSVFLGKPDAVRLVLVGLLGSGHVLIEDVPGVGKTLLARALARSINCTFRRIQFTSDLLPSDIIGVSIYDAKQGKFDFQPGPLFANVVLADEINRTTPRTQSSLLEAMNEQQVSVDGHAHPLPPPFLVLATQNPFELEGTYPLPESQLDRFFIRIRIGYPDADHEKRILTDHVTVNSVEELQPVLAADQVVALQHAVETVRLSHEIRDYLLEIVRRTRASDRIRIGVSPRGALALFDAARALAMIEDRDFVIPDDVKQLVKPVLQHRLLCRGLAGRTAARDDVAGEVLDELLDAVPVPV